MKNLSIQKEPGWCVVHTLINVLRAKNLDKYFKDEKYKACTLRGINQILKDNFTEFQMHAIINIPWIYPAVRFDYLYSILATNEKPVNKIENLMVPYFLTVHLPFKSTYHYIAVIKINDMYYYCDPYQESIIKLRGVHDLENYVHEIRTVERLVSADMEYFLAFDAKNTDFEKLL